MRKKSEARQEELEFISIGALVPEQHLSRKVDAAVDFSFIREPGEAPLLRGQRPSGAGASGTVQAVAAWLFVRGLLGAAVGAGGRLRSDLIQLMTAYESQHAFWISGDPFEALKAVFILFRPQDQEQVCEGLLQLAADRILPTR